MYDRILVPTDGSAGVELTTEEATDLAAVSGATIHGLYVVDTRDYSTLSESKWLPIETELEEAGERALAEIERAATDAGVESTTAIERGIPHEEILKYVDAHAIDLVVMGTHGRTGLNRFLIGSVTEKVVRSAEVPVLVVHIAADAGSEE